MIAWLLRRRLGDASRARLVRVAGASYASLFALLLWQALRGQSILQPDIVTTLAFAAWLALTAAAAWLAAARPRLTHSHAVAV
jgi:hypothetical protein